jgi:hypothetical protein
MQSPRVAEKTPKAKEIYMFVGAFLGVRGIIGLILLVLVIVALIYFILGRR